MQLKYYSCRYQHLAAAERKSLLWRSYFEMLAWLAVIWLLIDWIPYPWFDFSADHGYGYSLARYLVLAVIGIRVVALALRYSELQFSKPWQEPTETPRDDAGNAAV
jgi:hypothetical protein